MAIIGEIYKVGVPSIIMQSIGSLMTYGMNQILLAFTSTAATVFGVYFKLQSFVFMPIFGLNNGMVPIVAYNFGARNKERLTRTVKLSMVYAVCLMAAGFLVFQIFRPSCCPIINYPDRMPFRKQSIHHMGTYKTASSGY